MEKQLVNPSPALGAKGGSNSASSNSSHSSSKVISKQEFNSFGGRSNYKSVGKKQRESLSNKSNNGPRYKNGVYEKKVRPRGGSGSVGDYNVWCSEVMPLEQLNEPGEKLKNGSKKHNLNHLLNFSFTPREQGIRSSRIGYRPARYNKEQFIQANCQFIVKEGNDYTVNKSNPDLPIDWSSIEEIRFNSTSETTVCPICLHTPQSAKITRCGHIYCLTCLLHYLALTDRSWRKCPICYESIHKDDLKSVSTINRVDFKVGNEICLVLMKRKKGSVISTPIFYEKSTGSFMSVDDDDSLSCYNKVLTASPSQVLRHVIAREESQLQCQLKEDGETPEACFIESAFNLLSERKKAINGAMQCTKEEVTPKANEKPQGESNVENTCPEPTSDIDFSTRKLVKGSKAIELTEEDKLYYFYQSIDGQQIYLNSLNVKMLCREYGSLDQCPNKIFGKLLEMEGDTMTEHLRNRYRYLQHLPLTCEIKLAEIEFNSNILSSKTYEEFQEEINKRKRNRNKKEKRERQRDYNIKMEENKRLYGIYPQPNYQLNSFNHFPSCNIVAEAEQLPTQPENVIPSPVGSSDCFHPSNDCSPALSVSGSPPMNVIETSFAKMLRDGKAKPVDKIQATATRNDDIDEEYKPQQHHYSLGDALEAALNSRASEGKKKKNKKKK